MKKQTIWTNPFFFLHSIFFLLASSGCEQNLSVGPSSETSEITDAEYAVLSVVVEPEIGRPFAPVYVLYDSTSGGIGVGNTPEGIDTTLTRLLAWLSRELPGLKAETMQDFKEVNLAPAFIQYPARINPNCVRSSATQQRVPWVSVSRVGFSGDRLQALAYAGYVYGPLAGVGYYYLLSRTSPLERWTVVHTLMAWVS